MDADKIPFDPTQPHGEVFGGGYTAKYVQEGRYYDSQLNLVNFDTNEVLVYQDELQSVAEEVDEVEAAPPPTLEQTPWVDIKKMVEDSGEVYTNKSNGIKHLRSLS